MAPQPIVSDLLGRTARDDLSVAAFVLAVLTAAIAFLHVLKAWKYSGVNLLHVGCLCIFVISSVIAFSVCKVEEASDLAFLLLLAFTRMGGLLLEARTLHYRKRNLLTST